jgi:HlyD family secretion protein
VLSIEASDSNYIAQKKLEIAKAQEYYQELLNKQKLLSMAALIPGSLYAWDEDLKPGFHVPEGTIIGKISMLDEYYALAFVPENQIESFKIGEQATVIQLHPFIKLPGVITRINPAREETLEYLNMASLYRGPLPVAADESGKHLILVESYYVAYVRIDSATAKNLKIGQMVEVSVKGPWQSKLMQILRYIRRIILRESSL